MSQANIKAFEEIAGIRDIEREAVEAFREAAAIHLLVSAEVYALDVDSPRSAALRTAARDIRALPWPLEKLDGTV